MADLRKINWDNYLKIYKNDPDLSFELFLRKINFLYNKHSPLVTSKRKIKRNPSKPWLTSGIIKSITVKTSYTNNFGKPPTQYKELILIKNAKPIETK